MDKNYIGKKVNNFIREKFRMFAAILFNEPFFWHKGFASNSLLTGLPGVRTI